MSHETNPIAEAAEKAVKLPHIESAPGWCSKFCRQTVAIVHGAKYRHLFGASARETCQRFADAGLLVPVERGSIPGDLLFKCGPRDGEHGHVGIRVLGNRVAENSSTTKGRVQGAKGFRTVAQFGKVTHIARLPVV